MPPTVTADVERDRGFGGRRFPIIPLTIVVLGLVLGLVAGFAASKVAKQSYITTSTFAIVPSGASTVLNTQSQLGQLVLLTPVISALVSDPQTQTAVEALGSTLTDKTVIPGLVPNSPLLFTLQVRGETARGVTDTAHNFETVLPQLNRVQQIAGQSGASVVVVSSALLPTVPTGPSTLLLVAAGGVIGAILAGWLAWAYTQRSRRAGEGRIRDYNAPASATSLTSIQPRRLQPLVADQLADDPVAAEPDVDEQSVAARPLAKSGTTEQSIADEPEADRSALTNHRSRLRSRSNRAQSTVEATKSHKR